MTDPTPTIDQALDQLEAAVHNVVTAAMSEAQIPDATGRGRKGETDLQTWRLAVTKELGYGTTKGEHYQVVAAQGKLVRNFNVPAILDTLLQATEHGSPSTLLHDLMQRDVLRINVQWTNLQKEFGDAQAMLKLQHKELTPDEIGDLDAPHVGQYRGKPPAPKIEGVKPDKGGKS